jgi:biopolymer transport protein ExbB
MNRIRVLLAVLSSVLVLTLLPSPAHAWWNPDWKYRKKVTLDASPQGADIREEVGPLAIAVRLHTGNFLFTDAKSDGSDIRFVAGDDKTPLKHFIETFDANNQLAILWVQVPRITPGAATDAVWMYSGNDKAVAANDPKGVFGADELLRLNFSEPQEAFADQSAYANAVTATGVTANTGGFAGTSAALSGTPIRVAMVPAARVVATGQNAGVTFSAWIKPMDPLRGRLIAWGPFTVDLSGGTVNATLGTAKASGGKVLTGEWTHIAVTASNRLAVYVNGTEVAAQPAALVDLAGDLSLGLDYVGDLDVVQLASAARTASAVRAEAMQGMDGKLLVYGEPEVTEAGGGHGYIAVLFNSLTVDAIVVIVICALMLVIAIYVMVTKAVLLARTDRGNADFLDEFENQLAEFLDPQKAPPTSLGNGRLKHSSLARLYETGMKELRHRVVEQKRSAVSAEAITAIKASIDSTLIREMQRLNRSMVLLTIAISGGPFLGLLGTVVGVMITFASIAAAGDVNINVIAPGIAAALLATVAGLAVAIPALFGYNYLLTRVKGITADMQAFSDEFVAKMAEHHSN